MLKRKIEQDLIKWKNTKNHKPLIVKGCRQCGKTYSVKKFAEEILEKLSSEKELSTDYFVPGSHEYKRLGNLNVVPKASASCTG